MTFRGFHLFQIRRILAGLIIGRISDGRTPTNRIDGRPMAEFTEHRVRPAKIKCFCRTRIISYERCDNFLRKRGKRVEKKSLPWRKAIDVAYSSFVCSEGQNALFVRVPRQGCDLRRSQSVPDVRHVEGCFGGGSLPS